MMLHHTVSSSFLTFCFLSASQQLMRERQQMASRPFASVAVALGMGAEHTELVQPLIDVSKTLDTEYVHIINLWLFDYFVQC